MVAVAGSDLPVSGRPQSVHSPDLGRWKKRKKEITSEKNKNKSPRWDFLTYKRNKFMKKIVKFVWYSNDMFHYVFKAEFVTLVSFESLVGTPLVTYGAGVLRRPLLPLYAVGHRPVLGEDEHVVALVVVVPRAAGRLEGGGRSALSLHLFRKSTYKQQNLVNSHSLKMYFSTQKSFQVSRREFEGYERNNFKKKKCDIYV